MVEAYVGLPGTGKSLGCVYRCCEALKQGRTVYSNLIITDYVFGTKRQTLPFMGFQTLREASNCLIFIDEAHILMDSRDFGQLPKDIRFRLTETRKVGIDLLYTSQKIGQVEKRLRNITNYAWQCNNVGVLGSRIFRYDLYDPYDLEKELPKVYRDRLKVQFFFKNWHIKPPYIWSFRPNFLKKLYGSYDTFFIVGEEEYARYNTTPDKANRRTSKFA